MSLFKGGKGETIKKFYELDINEREIGILYLGLSGLLLRTVNHVVLTDPSDLLGTDGLASLKNLDLVLYTHGHYDHFNLKHCLEICEKTNAAILAETTVYTGLKGKVAADRLYEAKVKEKLKVGEIMVTCIKGVHVGPITLYIIEMDGIKIFHGGDSGYIPLGEYSADIAFLPTGKPSPTASPIDAFKMASDLKPKVAIPIHGSPEQHRKFEEMIKKEKLGIDVKIVEEFEALKLKV